VPLSLHHVAVQCHDLEACLRFYREVLELPLLTAWLRSGGEAPRGVLPPVSELRSVWLGVGDGFLALERASEPPRPGPWRDGRPGLHLLALRIAPREREAWKARLAAHRTGIVHETRWTLYVLDPEGNRVGLSHHPDEVA
jgi:catechol 2,3-dioxygenase-like lactoylglutathione lyase family enzyme